MAGEEVLAIARGQGRSFHARLRCTAFIDFRSVRTTVIYDALVIGGGPAGATVAWLLARSGWTVALLEKSAFPRRKVCGEFISTTSMPLLRMLGIDETFLDMAGPPVREVALYAGSHTLIAPMPVNNHKGCAGLGRALGREHLDCILLNGAKRAGVEVWQPWSAIGLARDREITICTAKQSGSEINVEIQARVVIAAHGSWDKGKLPTQISWQKPAPRDLLGFKAHFIRAGLPDGLMPLLAFPGGYGGMVHTDHGRVSLSCCIRRDVLQKRRNGSDSHQRAAEAVLAHILENCEGAQQALESAKADGPWLSAGPIRPGIRSLYKDGIFAVGNTAGEAHPVIAEGISIAMQGAWLLSEFLIAGRLQGSCGNTSLIGRAYARAWRRYFKPRLRSAAVFAHLAMRPYATKALLPLFKRIPDLLTVCARLSGKTTNIIAV